MSPKSNFFQRDDMGASLNSAMPVSIRSLSSALEVTQIWRRKVRAILEKAYSIRLSQEPCLGRMNLFEASRRGGHGHEGACLVITRYYKT